MSNLPDDVPTLGGRSKSPTDRPTLRELYVPSIAEKPVPPVLRSPPTRQKAFELAKQFLLGGQSQRDVGRDGIEDICLRVIADEEERQELEDSMVAL